VEISFRRLIETDRNGAGEAVNHLYFITRLFLALAMAATASSFARAQTSVDRIHRHNGVDSGKITAITPLGVTIAKGTVQSTVPSENIEGLSLAGEPPELSSARSAINAGRPQDALEALARLPTDNTRREEVLADIDFYTALAKAQLALAGKGAPEAATAEVRAFMARRSKSFHIPQAIEVLGNLLSAAGQHAAARAEYAKLAKAKSPYYELKSALLVGRSWQAEGDEAKALAEFEKVLVNTVKDPLIEPLRLAATLDRAVSQASTGNAEEAAAAIGEIIAKAEPEDNQLQARAYNALGDCYLRSGDNRGALFAFLHVDLLYDNDPEAHAKALHELVKLWKTAGRDARSEEAAEQLAEKYPNSRWAKP
jgi:tetratricopeptide (TPR) repeat protein